MKQAPHLFQCLTREEFQTVWAIRSTLGFEGFDDAYPLANYATPGTPKEADSYEEQCRRVIRYLALEHGFVFEGIMVDEDLDGEGSIRGVPVEPRNLLYAQSMKLYIESDGNLGSMPDPLHAVDVAERVLGERCPRLSLAPLTELRLELDRAVDLAPPPDETSWIEHEAEKNQALQALGVTRGAVH